MTKIDEFLSLVFIKFKAKKNPKPKKGSGFSFFGGADGTRTRDPRRDRPVF